LLSRVWQLQRFLAPAVLGVLAESAVLRTFHHILFTPDHFLDIHFINNHIHSSSSLPPTLHPSIATAWYSLLRDSIVFHSLNSAIHQHTHFKENFNLKSVLRQKKR
jgi:hypothetical protein